MTIRGRILLFLLLLPTVVHAERFFDVYEASAGVGTPGFTTSWMNYLSEVGPGVAMYNAKLTVGHQYGAQDFGPARRGLYYPVVGFSLNYLDYSHCHLTGKGSYHDHRYNFGKLLALSWHHSQHYLATDRFRLRTSWDMGLAYNFNHHTEDLPNLLLPIGGRVMMFLDMALLAGIRTSRYEWNIGPHFIHVSNCNMHEPNSGINNLGLTVSLRQNAADASKPARSIGDQYVHQWYLDLLASAGFTRVEHHPDNLYGQFNLSAAMMWQYNPHSAIGAGLDVSYLPVGDRTGREYYSGLSFAHTTWISHWSILGQVGCYLNARHPIMWKGTSRVYERIGIRYHPFRQKASRKMSPYIGYFVKGDGFTAQQMELSLGVCIF